MTNDDNEKAPMINKADLYDYYRRIRCFTSALLGLMAMFYIIYVLISHSGLNYQFLYFIFFLMIFLPVMNSLFFRFDFGFDPNEDSIKDKRTLLDILWNINKPVNKQLKTGFIKILLYWALVTVLLYALIAVYYKQHWPFTTVSIYSLGLVLTMGAICQCFVKPYPK